MKLNQAFIGASLLAASQGCGITINTQFNHAREPVAVIRVDEKGITHQEMISINDIIN